MKKTVTAFALLATLLFAVPANAQFKFGFRGGVNLTNLSLKGKFSNNLDESNRAGFYIGPTVKFTIPVIGISLDASALYDQRSAKVDIEDTHGNSYGTEEIRSQAIAIPINVRYGWGLGSLADIFLFAGPQFSFNVAKDKSLYANTADWRWKESAFSVNVGIGCTILSHVEAKANYNITCGKTGEATVAGTAQEAFRTKHNSWQIGLAYYF